MIPYNNFFENEANSMQRFIDREQLSLVFSSCPAFGCNSAKSLPVPSVTCTGGRCLHVACTACDLQARRAHRKHHQLTKTSVDICAVPAPALLLCLALTFLSASLPSSAWPIPVVSFDCPLFSCLWCQTCHLTRDQFCMKRTTSCVDRSDSAD